MNRLAVPFHGRIIGFPYWNKVGGAAPNPLASVPWVAQWKFNNNGNDSIGANHLTNNNSATFTTGILGGATGATQLVAASAQGWSVADNAALSMGNIDFMFAGWVYFKNTANGLSGMILTKDTGVLYEYQFYTTGGKVEFYMDANGGGHSVTTPVISHSTWHLVVCYHDSVNNLMAISIDAGTPVTVSHSTGTADTTGAVSIGRYTSGLYLFDGRIDNLCVAKGSGAVPTQTILDALYNSGNGTETLT